MGKIRYNKLKANGRIDCSHRIPDNERQADGMRTAQLTFKLNHTMPCVTEYDEVIIEVGPPAKVIRYLEKEKFPEN